MTPTHPNPRKLLRTAFTAVTALCVVVYLMTGWWNCHYGYADYPRKGLWNYYLGAGEVKITGISDFVQAPSPSYPRRVEVWKNHGWTMTTWPPFQHFSILGVWFVEVALWPGVFLMVIGLSWWYWRDWRRSRPPGFCRQCGYDLRATPNRCPECGHTPDPARL